MRICLDGDFSLPSLHCACSEGLHSAAESDEPLPSRTHVEAHRAAGRLPNGDAAAARQLTGKPQSILGVRVGPPKEEPRSKSGGVQQAVPIHAANVVAVSALKTKVEALRVEASTPGALNGK